ncbi:MAG: TRAP transporter small permease [Burkholderiaceae bacterium]
MNTADTADLAGLRDTPRDGLTFIDHLSRFSGISVAQFYLLVALVTVWEVFSRYVLHAPTTWAFEIVQVLCASAWMIASAYVTLYKRHIGITVLYLAAGDGTRWWLDLFAMVVGVVALFMLVDDTLIRALEAIDLREKMGSAFNSPQPMVLKTVLMLGSLMYLAQLLVNLYRHFDSTLMRRLTLLVGVLIIVRLLSSMGGHYLGEESLPGMLSAAASNAVSGLDPSQMIDAREYGIGSVSMVIVAVLMILMMTGMPLGIVTLDRVGAGGAGVLSARAACTWSRPTRSACSRATR